MSIPRDITQLALGLRFKPGAVDTVGLRIDIATHMPDRYKRPTTSLTATLRNVTPAVRKGRLPTYRFVIDETAYDNDPVQRTLATGRERLKRSYDAFPNDDPVKEFAHQRMAETPRVWLQFASAEWIVAMGDQATIHSTYGIPEPIGEIFQLNVLK